jgi:uncharacterized delta-60 repeat protein
MNARRLSLGFTVVLTLCAMPTHAVPGDLDLSFAGFGAGGVAIQYGYPMGGGQRGMVVQPDGKIVVAGYTGDAMLVMRFFPDGSIDPAFGVGGAFQYSGGAYPLRLTSVALQADGKVVVAGWRDAGDHFFTDFLVARLTASGHLDPSFSSDGMAFEEFDIGVDVAYSVLVQPDGKIVAAGGADVGGDPDFAVVRYNPDGTHDNTFGGDGKRSFGFGDNFPGSHEACYDMALQSDGRIVLAGGQTSRYVSDGKFKIARLNGGDGSLDATFNNGGKVAWDSGNYGTGARAVAIDANGGIVVAGSDIHSYPGGPDVDAEAYVIRLLPNGLFDNSFDGNGRLLIDGLSGGFNDLTIQPDGLIVILGWHTSPDLDVKFAVYRLNPDGSADPTLFPPSGFGFPDIGGSDVGHALALLPDGRILAYGATGGTHVLLRLWPDGSPDAGGRQTLAFDDATFPPGSNEVGEDVAIQSDGKIVVVGQVANAGNTESDFALARFLPDGELDESFGSHGRVAFSFHNLDAAKAVAIQSDGKIVAAGYEGSGNGVNFLVARFDANGSLDPTFGFGGYNVVDFAGGADYGWAMALAPDQKIVVAGTAFDGVNNVYGIARFNTDGTLDNTFDGDGRRLWRLDEGLDHGATSVIVQSSGRIVAGGFVSSDFVLVRFTGTGTVDDTFGARGVARIDMGGNDYLNGLALGPNGTMYAAGARAIGGASDFAAAKYQSNGLPGTGWPDGKVYVNWGTSSSAYAVDVRGDGQVAIAGCHGNGIAWAQFSPSNGSPVVTGSVDFAGDLECALGVRFVGDNKLLVAGHQRFNNDRSIALAQFETTLNPSADVGDGPRSTTAIRLRAPTPNPLVWRSEIRFDLPVAGQVRLSLHDPAGRLVRTITGGMLEAGTHQMVWDGTDESGRRVPNGMYFVRLDAGHEWARTSVVVLR